MSDNLPARQVALPACRAVPRGVLALLLVLLLTACSGQAARPTPTPLLLPIGAPPSLPVAPAQSSAGAALPGRLLMVQAGDLWLWQGDAGQRLTNRGDLFQPAWAPGGAQIVCVQRGQSFSDIVLLPASGGEPQRLTDDDSRAPLSSFERIYDTLWAFYPAFSPDGSQVVFASQYGPPFGSPAAEYNMALYRVAAAPGMPRAQLFASDGGHVGRLAYGPDGAIVFGYAPLDGGPQQLLRLYAQAQAEQVPGVPAPSYDPAFSADGQWLAFAARSDAGTDIFAIPADGGSAVRLTTLGTARAPAFSPDGTLLAFLALAPGGNRFDLWVLDLAREADGLRAGAPRQITRDMGLDADSGLAWAP